ncbi:DUF1800 domain-containing protein [Aureivirga marina]|uniref:DUF1800 domain-containing protein n=1 Tax=Aureivirga marina TaxID=1182451 RepID=UPI0018CA1856|nr:DUF1800 domain-containing protein [Aureivirga marina]
MKKIELKHLCNRAGFGSIPTIFEKYKNTSRKEVVTILFAKHTANEPFQLNFDIPQNIQMLPKEEKKKAIRKITKSIQKLNFAYIQKLANSDAFLREKVTLFWHGHFACRTRKSDKAQQLNNTIRKYALGNFRDLVLAVAKEPAMLDFLNNKQNRKSHPNENFARELMELFTIGRDNYTEKDIQEAARAFTGWNYNKQGEFVIRRKFHDYGEKTFFGKTGNFDGTDIIDILLEDKRTAKFIATKMHRYFVNDYDNPSEIDAIANVLYNSDYNITETLKYIFNADWFYATENVGTKIKSPIEFLTGLHRTFSISYQNKNATFIIQKMLGQVLFLPPNVAGWPSGKKWIDSSSLTLRLKLPSILLNNGAIPFYEKGDDVDNVVRRGKGNRKLRAETNWEGFMEATSDFTQADLIDYLITPDLSPTAKNICQDLSLDKKQNATVLVSLPEYQMC